MKVMRMPVTVLLWVMLSAIAWIAVDVSSEYSRLNAHLSGMRTNIRLAVDMGAYTSMASEEFFSGNTAAGMSQASNGVYNKIVYYDRDNSSWVSGNIYALALKAKADNGFNNNLKMSGLPGASFAAAINMNTLASAYGVNLNGLPSPAASDIDYVYSCLYGGSVTRTVRPEFLAFYNSVGGQLQKRTFLVEYESGKFKDVLETRIPRLAGMGLNLASYNNASGTLRSNATVQARHTGKDSSVYYLTPYSLGVTYLPPEVLKTAVLANLNNLVRFSKVGRTNDITSADGCVEGLGGDFEHTLSGSEYVMNDGYVEYDLNSLDLKIEYFVVNMYEQSGDNYVNADLLREIYGGRPGKTNAQQEQAIGDYLKGSDYEYKSAGTAEERTDAGMRVVARVTATVNVAVPYRSLFLRWYVSQKNGMAGYNNNQLGIYDGTGDGWIPYTYTTYVSVGR